MNIVIWSDFLCPYCILGKKRLEAALANLGITDANIEMKSFLLNPESGPDSGESMLHHLKKKYGQRERDIQENFRQLTAAGEELGVKLDFDNARHAGTNKAHALFQYAKTKGLGIALSDRLQLAAYQEGLVLDDEQVLIGQAEAVGIPGDEAKVAMGSQEYLQKAEEEYQDSLRYGASGVPFFVFNERLALSGAQPVAVFEKALKKAIGKD